MSFDLKAPGTGWIETTGGGTSAGDVARQTVQVSQTNLGAIPVADAAAEGALGTTADSSWSGSGNASVVAALKAIALKLGGSTVIDGSGSIASAGLAQNLFGGVIPTHGYLVQNLSGGPLYVNDTGAATAGAGSILIPANGSMWVTPAAYLPAGAVSLFGATLGQAFTAKRW